MTDAAAKWVQGDGAGTKNRWACVAAQLPDTQAGYRGEGGGTGWPASREHLHHQSVGGNQLMPRRVLQLLCCLMLCPLCR